MFNDLEATIQKLISASAATIAEQIAQAVRQSVAAELLGPAASPTTTLGAVEPKRRGRPAGKKAAPKMSRSKRSAPLTQAHLDAVLAVIRTQPGLGASAVQAAVGLDKPYVARALAKLRQTQAVKLTGEKRLATYSVA